MHWGTIHKSRRANVSHFGHPPPCHCPIHATCHYICHILGQPSSSPPYCVASVLSSQFGQPPPPLVRYVINGWSLAGSFVWGFPKESEHLATRCSDWKGKPPTKLQSRMGQQRSVQFSSIVQTCSYYSQASIRLSMDSIEQVWSADSIASDKGSGTGTRGHGRGYSTGCSQRHNHKFHGIS